MEAAQVAENHGDSDVWPDIYTSILTEPPYKIH